MNEDTKTVVEQSPVEQPPTSDSTSTTAEVPPSIYIIEQSQFDLLINRIEICIFLLLALVVLKMFELVRKK